jgi:hypothetical protein
VSQQDASEAAEHDGGDGRLSVPDERLPEDLQPAEDNPLAQPAGDDVPDDALTQDVGPDGSGGGSGGASEGGDDASGTSSDEAPSETG